MSMLIACIVEDQAGKRAKGLERNRIRFAEDTSAFGGLELRLRLKTCCAVVATKKRF